MLADGTTGANWVAWRLVVDDRTPRSGRSTCCSCSSSRRDAPRRPASSRCCGASIAVLVVGRADQPFIGRQARRRTRAWTTRSACSHLGTAPYVISPTRSSSASRSCRSSCASGGRPVSSGCSSAGTCSAAILTALLFVSRARDLRVLVVHRRRAVRDQRRHGDRAARRRRDRDDPPPPLRRRPGAQPHARLRRAQRMRDRRLRGRSCSASGAIASGQGTLIAAAAAAVVALAAAPLRSRLQRGVNRLLYGARDEPASAVADLGAAPRGDARAGRGAADARRCRRRARCGCPTRPSSSRRRRLRARRARRHAARRSRSRSRCSPRASRSGG